MSHCHRKPPSTIERTAPPTSIDAPVAADVADRRPVVCKARLYTFGGG